MGFFDYQGGDGRALIGDAYMLASYSASPWGVRLENGWEELDAADLGVSSGYYSGGFFTDNGSLLDGEAKVLVQKDAAGNITKMSISFAATNSLLDIYDYGAMYSGTYDNAFSYLFDAVRDYAQDNGLTGEDVIITGYSLGGGATNAAEAGRLENSGGFFAESDYMGFATPLIGQGDNLFNFGFENDAVYRLARGNETSTDNLVLFDTTYADPNFASGGLSLGTAGGWDAHIEGYTYNKQIFNAIADSNFYDLMERDSVVIVSGLTGEDRSSIWVEPVNRTTGNHVGDDAFILGTSGGDLLRGSTGDDHLDGHAGDDILDGGAGNDFYHGGAGADAFLFHGNFGNDVVVDFGEGDVIAFDAATFGSANEALSSAFDTLDGVVLNSGNNSILIEGVSLNELNTDDFYLI